MENTNSFSVLESKILNTNNEDNISVYEGLDNLSSPQVYNFGEILKYTLASSAVLEQQGMLNNYFHIGGGATLLHIANTIGIENIGSWRGTHDIDVVVTEFGVRGVLKSYFDIYEEFDSKSIENKKKIEIKDIQAQDSVDIDLYLPRFDKKTINVNGYEIPPRILKELKTINIMGVNTKVPKLHDLISMKLKVDSDKTHLPRRKDMSDIFNLLGCIEKNDEIKEKYTTNRELANYVYKKLDIVNLDQNKKLLDVINYSKKNKLDYIISAPSSKFIEEYRKKVNTYM